MGVEERKAGCLSLAEVIAFSGDAADDDRRKEISAHLSTCEKCRGLFTATQTLRSAGETVVSQIPPTAYSSDEIPSACIPTETMGDYLGGRLPEDERSRYSAHVKECGHCFDRAAHLTASGARMARGVLEMETTPQHFMDAVAPRVVKRVPAFSHVADVLRRAIFSPVPAYAFAAVLLIFMLTGRTGGPSGAVIPLESDKAYFIYEKPEAGGPAFGFSDAGRKVGETGAELIVRQAGGEKVEFRWNPVKGADDYNLMVMELTTRGPKEIFDTKTTDTSATVDANILSKGKAYRWRVTTMGENGRVYLAVGQFAYGG